IPDGTTLNWENTGTTNSSDFVDAINSGTVVIVGNTGKISRTLVNDYTTEGEESIIIEISTGSIPKKVLATTTVKVLDTSVPTYTVIVNTVKINEGQTITYTINTRGVPDGTTLNWENIGTTNADDFTDTLNSGTVTISNNTATLTRTLANDLKTEGNETVQIQLKRNGLNVAKSDTTLVLDTSVVPPPTYRIVPDKTSVDEGDSVTYTITTTNLPNGTKLYWNTKVDVSATNKGDFEDAQISGEVIVNNNIATVVRTLRRDNATEGRETLILELRAINSNGTIVATATPVTVNDTSVFLVPTYAISADKTSVDEGDSVTYTITTTNVPNGRQLYWINKGTTQGNDFRDILPQGVVIINNNSGTIVRTLVNDTLTEGSETISLEVRDGSYSGTIVIPASSNLVTVNDTSKTPDPTYSIVVVGNSLTFNEGLWVSYSVKTTRIANGTTLYWTNSGTTDAADFSDNQNSGSFLIRDNSFTLSRQLKQDKKTEGNETIVIQVRTGSITGPIVATAPTVTISDTSKG
ncbi:MAG: hypothetical protein EBU90_27840, partial [Proteobacteria bacterium]|nr:hypothetical protein [Pseudomonadota bacterium]